MSVVDSHAYMDSAGEHCVHMFVGTDRDGFCAAQPDQYHLLHLFLCHNNIDLMSPHTLALSSVYHKMFKFGGGVGLASCYLMNVQSGVVQQVRIRCERLRDVSILRTRMTDF